MNKYLKRVTALLLSISTIFLSTANLDGSGQILKNDNITKVAANSVYGSYIKYYSSNDYVEKILKGKDNIQKLTYSTAKYHFLDTTHGKARRYRYDIPNEMNCTVICIENLMLSYRRKLLGKAVTDSDYTYYYNEIMNSAKQDYKYSTKNGLPLSSHKTLCEDTLNKYVFSYHNIEAKVKTKYCVQEMVTLSAIPKKPFILSSSTTYHSIYVAAAVTYHYEYIQNGKKKSKDVDFFECYDPNGEYYLLEAGKISTGFGDIEQIMYVDIF